MLVGVLSIGAFAAEGDPVVTIYVQRAERNSEGAVVSTTQLITTPMTVSVTSGQTLRDVLDECISTISNAKWGFYQDLCLVSLDCKWNHL